MTTYTEEYEEKPDQAEGGMSFLEHLDELRSRLIRIAIFLLIAFAVSWAFSDKIYNFLEVPVRAAMLEAYYRGGFKLIGAEVATLHDLPDGAEVNFTFPGDSQVGSAIVPTGTTIKVKVQRDAQGTPQLVTASPWVLNERAVVMEGFVIAPALYSPSSMLLNPNSRLVVQTVQGAFNLYLKVSFYAAIFFGVPFFLTQIWGFISPGLYPHEKKYAVPFILMSTVFFVMGCAFAYYIAFPRAASFLLGVAAEGNLRPLVAADEYFDLILTIMLGLGVVFEIPTITFFLARLGLVTPGLLARFWRFAIMVIFIIAALLSPTTDIPNLLVFAAPMLILYVLSIGIAWAFHRKREANPA